MSNKYPRTPSILLIIGGSISYDYLLLKCGPCFPWRIYETLINKIMIVNYTLLPVSIYTSCLHSNITIPRVDSYRTYIPTYIPNPGSDYSSLEYLIVRMNRKYKELAHFDIRNSGEYNE